MSQVNEAGEPGPVCYRHADRETYVRCTRCDRPICPDCMTAASVGFQCPDCVKEGNRTVREARTPFGGRVGAQGTATYVLIGLNVLGFLYELTLGERRVLVEYGMSPVQIAAGEWFRLLTSAFLHIGIAHIALNMLALYSLGTAVERMLGTWRFVGLYLAGALAGSVASYVFSPIATLGAGASGAVYALFGAYFVVARRMRADTSQIVGIIALNVVLSFAIPSIDWRAHLGGLVAGAALTSVFAYVRRPPRDLLHAFAIAAVVVVAAGVTVARTDALRARGCRVVTVDDQRFLHCPQP